MNYKKLYIMMYILVGFTLTGCGGGGGGSSSDATVSTPQQALHMKSTKTLVVKHFTKRAMSSQNNSNNTQIIWEYDNHEGLKIHLDSSFLYFDFRYSATSSNIQFFIDSDNNSATGNIDEGGADYMIENGYLYKSTNPNSWAWQEITKIQILKISNNQYTIKIKLSDIKNLSVIFGVNAQALDSSWHPLQSSPIDSSKSIYSSNQNDSINWSTISPFASNGDKVIKVFDTDKFLYIQLEQKNPTEHIQIYIDSDNNSDTGYKSSSWSNFGRDFLVEDNELYKYTGVGSWGWQKVANIQRKRKNNGNDILEVAINKSLISLSKNIKIAVETNGKNWSNTTFIPIGNVPVYSFDKIVITDKKIVINEVMAANSHTILDPDYFTFSDWIELYNPNSTTVNISGYSLSDKLNEQKWKFPNGTTIPAKSYLLVWADEKDTKKNALHTNFKLKMKGEAVALFDKDGKFIDSLEYLKQRADISIKLVDKKIKYMSPTPNRANSQSFVSAVLTKKPTFSLKEGFYNNSKTLTLSSNAPIYYTTDGSLPTKNSNRYSSAINIFENMVVRAISIKVGKFSSKVITKSYFIGENIDIPVVSLSTDDKYLFDDMIGIYTIGKNGKEVLECGDDNTPTKANYAQKWERPAHIEVFENNNKVVISQDIGIKLSGECSRSLAQKSFQLKSDKKYGKDAFEYQIFKDKPIKKFAKLKLRNAGQDFEKTHIRDVLQQYIVKDSLNVQYEAYRPALVFINGKFWGLYSIREKLGKDYIKENFGEKKVNLIEDDLVEKEGSSQEFDDLVEYLHNNSLESTSNYNYIKSKIDIDNFIDYYITNIYFANTDWPGSNLIYWKAQKASSKWQWILHDMDFGLARYPSDYGVSFDSLAMATALNGPEWPNPQWSTLLLRKLLENSSFKATFKSRFLNYIDTTFKPSRAIGIVDTIASKISPYIQRHIDRWRVNGEYSYAVDSKSDWDDEIGKIKYFINNRPNIMKSHIQDNL